MLWIQAKVEEEELKVNKVAGEENPADLIIKDVNEAKVIKFMDMTNQEYQ